MKIERDTKSDQLKQKNKTLDKSQSELQTEKQLNSNLSNKVTNLETKNKNLNQKLCEISETLKQEKKKCKKLDIKKNVKSVSTETEKIGCEINVKSSFTQTDQTKMKSTGTSPLFTKLEILGEPTHDITCFCTCHKGSEGECLCEIQLFQYTVDPEAALDAIYYRPDYDNWTNDEQSDEANDSKEDGNESVFQKLLHMKPMLDNEVLMKELIKETLDTWVNKKGAVTNEQNDSELKSIYEHFLKEDQQSEDG